ncbi:MAG: FkbM family methyltransferase [Ginsengibacter sp.]
MLFTKSLRRYTMRYPSNKLREKIRNNWRKICVDEEIKIPVKHGFWMNVSPKDYATYGIYFFGNYDPSMTSVFKHLVMPGDTVWDIGTERGWFTLLMASIVGEKGRVDSFEAFPPTVEKLKANINLNNFNWVHVKGCAVSNTNSSMWFVPPSNHVTHNVSFLQDCNGVGYLTNSFQPGCIEVKTICLDDYYQRERIQKVSLIKIDIEGAEVSALKGAKKLIEKDKPVLAVEFNRQTAMRANCSIEELYELITFYGYKMYVFHEKFLPFDLNAYDGVADVVLNVYCFPIK